MTSEKAVARRRYSVEFKAQVLAECEVPGASVAKVAMSHGINTNVVHGWRKLARQTGAVANTAHQEFVPIRLPQPAESPAVDFHPNLTQYWSEPPKLDRSGS